MKISLLIVDMQKGFLIGKIDKGKIDKACEHINYVGELLRSKGHPIIHIKDLEGVEIKNEAEFDFIDDIQQEPKDQMITKLESNAFWNTDLEERLKSAKVNLLIVSGFAAEHCVLSTYNGARERGFKTAILRNGILSRVVILAMHIKSRNPMSLESLF